MGVFANKIWVNILAWGSALLVIVFTFRLAIGSIGDWISSAKNLSFMLLLVVVAVTLAIVMLLLYISVPKKWRKRRLAMPSEIEELEFETRPFSNIGVALDLSKMDSKILSQAKILAQQNNAHLVLFHVVEGVGGQLFGKNAYDNEARDDLGHVERHAEQLRTAGLDVQAVLGFGRIPKEIVRIADEQKIDLLVMGAHGHRGLKDIIFGTSISKVRHKLKIPILVVR
jgi:manganese transport protein